MKYKIKKMKGNNVQSANNIIQKILREMSNMSKDIFKINNTNEPEFREYFARLNTEINKISTTFPLTDSMKECIEKINSAHNVTKLNELYMEY
jgi:hypothetical protein